MERLDATDAGIAKATEILKAGGLVAFPTETVYGLGADGFSAAAVRSIFEAKGRPADNPLILHVASPEMAAEAGVLDEHFHLLASRFWPGPLTLVVPRRPVVPDEVTAGLSSVALRMPDHPMALQIIESVGRPLAAPSANSSGRPSPTTAQHVVDDLGDRIAAVLDGGPCRVGLESTVLTLCGVPKILRPGAVTAGDLERILGVAVENEQGSAASPGTRHEHYRPRCPIRIFEGGDRPAVMEQDGVIGYTGDAASCRMARRAGSLEDYGRHLYAWFRSADAAGVETLYVELPPAEGLGSALRDRILRAAGSQ